jgi:hypothetical protein
MWVAVDCCSDGARRSIATFGIRYTGDGRATGMVFTHHPGGGEARNRRAGRIGFDPPRKSS